MFCRFDPGQRLLNETQQLFRRSEVIRLAAVDMLDAA